MLRLTDNQHQLDILCPYGRAWIEHYPRVSQEVKRLGEVPDWRLWLHEPGKAPSLCKSPTRVLIESQLRSWVLRQSKRCLAMLTFDELVLLAHGRPAPAPNQVYYERPSAD